MGRTRLAVMLAIAGGLASAASGASTLLRDDARVMAAQGGTLLYRETHWVEPGANPTRWVLYRCADGAAFARKRISPDAGTLAPNFAFEDGRDGYREGVRGTGAARTVFVRDGRRAERSRTLQLPPDGVIDAGFDAAVRRHWAALMRGEDVRLQFLVPSRKRFYPVRVQRVAAAQWNGVKAERLRMRLDAWFGFAVPEVTLVYASADRRLLEFSGTGNVRDARGANPQVRIVFDPKPERAPAAELQAAIAAPLAGRCDF